ncbi:hypothetical protein, partial [Porphyromonas gingivalis]|uniref:hypothetical protein n=1 Tax=Porphyromonas gingivalis TaxID=837 RepID=UPI001C54C0C4
IRLEDASAVKRSTLYSLIIDTSFFRRASLSAFLSFSVIPKETIVSLGITEKERNADSEALRKKLVSMINEYKVDLLTADASSSL